jgi:hypothetical protein
VKTGLKEYSEIEAQDGYAWSDGDCEVVERSTLVWVSTEERSNAATIKALAWPGDHDFIETSKHRQDQEVSVLQYDYHTEIMF